jgi:ribosome maturation protein Sdo1
VQDAQSLMQTLTMRMEAISRIADNVDRQKDPLPHERVERAMREARVAIGAGSATALAAAIRSLDFLSLELCEE